MKTYDLLGVGIGPSNLSTAALLWPFRNKIESIFFDEREKLTWHSGTLFPEATIQVSILKDLVTMVDPTSQFSFLNFLKKTGRLYLFAAKGKFGNMKRIEFLQYFIWVANQLQNLNFSTRIDNVTYSNGLYEVFVNGRIYKAKNLLLGVGLSDFIPDFCKGHVGNNVFHSSRFLCVEREFANKRILVVGGGQSSAEIILHLLNNENQLPAQIAWLCSTYNLLPLENTPFSNELFTPNYSNFFYQLNSRHKAFLLGKQKHASDGINELTLDAIYEKAYDQKCLGNIDILRFYMGAYLTNIEKSGDLYRVAISFTQERRVAFEDEADIVILATGFEYKIPCFLRSILQHLSVADGKFDIAEDYSIVSDGRLAGKIYLNNASRHTRGIADPNLSLSAWRSAKIINSVCGSNLYNTDNDRSIIDWTQI